MKKHFLKRFITDLRSFDALIPIIYPDKDKFIYDSERCIFYTTKEIYTKILYGIDGQVSILPTFMGFTRQNVKVLISDKF